MYLKSDGVFSKASHKKNGALSKIIIGILSVSFV